MSPEVKVSGSVLREGDANIVFFHRTLTTIGDRALSLDSSMEIGGSLRARR